MADDKETHLRTVNGSDKKVLIFDLAGQIFDGKYGARYYDAKGLFDIYNREGYDVDMYDDLSELNPNDYHIISIFPKPESMFRDRPEAVKDLKTQLDFLKSLATSPCKDSIEINLFFNDIKITLKDTYNGINPFKGFKCNAIIDMSIYSNESKDKQRYLSIFDSFSLNPNKKNVDALHQAITEHYQLHQDDFSDMEHHQDAIEIMSHFIGKNYLDSIDEVHFAHWLIPVYLPHLMQIRDKVNPQSRKSCPINNLYYGGYRENTIDSLKKSHFGESDQDVLISNNLKLQETFPKAQDIQEMEINQIAQMINLSRHNLIPFEKGKTNRQVTARVLENLLFTSSMSQITADRWKFLKILKQTEKLFGRKMMIELLQDHSNDVKDYLININRK